MTINLSYKDIFSNTDRYLIVYGGAGSGKSVAIAQKLLLRSIQESPHRILVLRKVAKTIRNSIFQLFKDMLVEENLYEHFDINKTEMTFTNKLNGNTIISAGLDDPERLKSIAGITAVWIEEASEVDRDDFFEIDRRLRGFTKYYKQIIISFNPISHLHWLKEHFFDNTPDDTNIIKTTYEDNMFIDDKYKQVLENMKNYDYQQYRIYCLGEWGILNENKVYHNFDPAAHISTIAISPDDVLHCGIDFNVGGCAFIMAKIDDKDQVHIIRAFAKHNTLDLISTLLTIPNKLILYPDASGYQRTTNATETDIALLKKAGFFVVADKQNPPVRDRINSVNYLFATNKLFINKKEAEKLYVALQSQTYKDNGDPEKSNDHKGGSFDDYNDALGYFIHKKYPINKFMYNKVYS